MSQIEYTQEVTPDPLLIEAVQASLVMLPMQPRRWLARYGGIIPLDDEEKALKSQYRKAVIQCNTLIS